MRLVTKFSTLIRDSVSDRHPYVPASLQVLGPPPPATAGNLRPLEMLSVVAQ